MQCDVHRKWHDRTGEIPFLLDVQAELLSDLVMVPFDTIGF
jgi:hypothetical protein